MKRKYLKELMELESEKYKLEKIKHDIIRFEVNDLKVINNGILNCQKHINKNINTIKEISVANFLLR